MPSLPKHGAKSSEPAANMRSSALARALQRRPAGQLVGSGNLLATVAAERALPAAVAELDRFTISL